MTASNAIHTGRSLLGTPYSTIDCINFIKKIIRTTPGGNPKYTVAGTTSLWRSHTMTNKYKDLTEIYEGLDECKPGMLVFPDDVSHVGIVTEKMTVLHSSKSRGCVVETDLYTGYWTKCAVHRFIAVGEEIKAVNEPVYTDESSNEVRTYIVCAEGGLRQRKTPGGEYMQNIPDGSRIEAMQIKNGWIKTTYRDHIGWVSAEYCLAATGND